jgi:hypothetical protein
MSASGFLSLFKKKPVLDLYSSVTPLLPSTPPQKKSFLEKEVCYITVYGPVRQSASGLLREEYSTRRVEKREGDRRIKMY